MSGWKRLTCRSCVQIAAVKAALGNVPEETRGNVEKKQARTYEELQAEQAEQEQARSCPLLMLVNREDSSEMVQANACWIRYCSSARHTRQLGCHSKARATPGTASDLSWPPFLQLPRLSLYTEG